MSLESKLHAIERSGHNLVFEEPLKILGDGTFGTCVRARQYGTNAHSEDTEAVPQIKSKKVAIKISKAGGEAIRLLHAEIRILKKLSHKHIIGFLGAGSEKDDTKAKFNFLTLELAAHGSLQDWFNSNRKPLSKVPILYEIFQGLDYIHAAGTYHRDIKPDNILVDQDSKGNYIMKLADFGLAEKQPLSRNENGSKMYQPPEMWKPSPPYDNAAVDVYSAALILIQMMDPQYKLPWTDRAGQRAWLDPKRLKSLNLRHSVLDFFRASLTTAQQRESAHALVARLDDTITEVLLLTIDKGTYQEERDPKERSTLAWFQQRGLGDWKWPDLPELESEDEDEDEEDDDDEDKH